MFVVKFLAQFRHCDSFRKTFLSNGFIQAIISFLFYYILNGFEVCFCKLQTEYFSLRICDHFKAKLAVFSLARGVGRNTERGKEVSFLPTMLRKIIISQGVLNITKEKQRPFEKTIYQPLNACWMKFMLLLFYSSFPVNFLPLL